MKKVVEVKVIDKCRTYDTGGIYLKPGDEVVVEIDRGVEVGKVMRGPKEAIFLSIALKKVIRKVTSEDRKRIDENRRLERSAVDYCQERIEESGIRMKLIDVHYLFDGSKAIFYFSASKRVDFRELVRDLARKLHTRIEMRQINVREGSKVLGGIGPCGLELCCNTFLNKIKPVSLRMAKEQDITPNPDKITGICGRLLCCLDYEYENYKEFMERLPRIGSNVIVPQGEGRVVSLNVLKKTVKVELEDKIIVELPEGDVKVKGLFR